MALGEGPITEDLRPMARSIDHHPSVCIYCKKCPIPKRDSLGRQLAMLPDRHVFSVKGVEQFLELLLPDYSSDFVTQCHKLVGYGEIV